jgi:hypothetical protein
MVEINQFSEKTSGYPKPDLYDHYYINKYSYPRGLSTYKKTEEELYRAKGKKSLYDIKP